MAGLCALGLEVLLRACVAAIIFPHAADNSLVWEDRHSTRRPPPGCTAAQNRCRSAPQAARSLAPLPAPGAGLLVCAIAGNTQKSIFMMRDQRAIRRSTIWPY